MSSTTSATQPVARAFTRSPTLERLTALALLIGLVTATSYAVGATSVLRIAKPALGAWLDARQFYLMEGGATAFGLIVGMRIGRRLAAPAFAAPYGTNLAMVFAALALAPLIHLCAAAARFGWAGRGGAVASWIIDRQGYDGGAKFYRLFLTAVYFFKTAGLALMAGLALIALAVAVAFWRDMSGVNESSPGL